MKRAGQHLKETITDRVRETKHLLDTSDILGRQSARADALLQKLESERITVAVIGQFKRGKSALVNALLEQRLLPVGIIPVTSAVTEITYGETGAEILFRNGLIQPVAIEELDRYISEEQNPDNILNVSSVRIRARSEFLEQGLTLVDTPGVGSFHKHNTEAAYAFVRESDAVIFMLSVDTPINEIEIEFLRNTRAFAGKFFFAVNKIDLVSEDDLSAFVVYCRNLLQKLMETDDITIFPISAKEGTGIDSLKQVLLMECRSGLLRILCESARLKLFNIIVEALSQIELYWKVLLMTPLVLDQTIRRMQEVLEKFRQRAQNTVEELEANRDIIIPGLAEQLDAQLNEFKLDLTDAVTDVFGMDYHYEIAELEQESRKDEYYPLASELGKHFLLTAHGLLDDLDATLSRVLLYRNESTPEVVTHIYELNRLTRTLRRTRDSLRTREEL